MNFQYQKGTSDCFPTCFYNAMHYFNIPISTLLSKRFDVFSNGTENCTIFSCEEHLEQYYRSIHKLIAEWHWACRYQNDEIHRPKPEPWTQYLINRGISMKFINGPIEHKQLLIQSISTGHIVLCEIWVPSRNIPDSVCRHYILIVTIHQNRLLIHDPFASDIQTNQKIVAYNDSEFGSNFAIDCEYFFRTKVGPMKPKVNRSLHDKGYKCILISKQ